MNYETAARPTMSIAAGASLSGASEDMYRHTLVGLQIGSAAIGSTWATSAVLTFDVNYDGGSTFYPLIDKDGEVSVATPSAVNSGAVFLALDPSKFAGVRKIKVRSGTKGSAVNQTAGVSVIIPVIRPLA